jgi:alkylhydroperoxidase family enzyme
MDICRAVGTKQGIPVEKVDALSHYATSDRFTAREGAALAYSEAIVREDFEVTDARVARLRELFSEAGSSS